MRGGRRSTSFKPGNKFGSKGRAKDDTAKKTAKVTVADIKQAAKELSSEAISTLKTAMASPDAPWAAKVKAAETILDRGWGRPEQTTNVNVSFFDQMTDDEQKTMLAALAALKDADEEKPETMN